MRFLYIRAKNSVDDLLLSLRAMGHEVQCLEGYSFDPEAVDEQALEALETMVETGYYDYLISNLFFEEPSDICERHGLPYISWVYDSPLVTLFSESASNSVNRIFIFDRALYNRVRERLKGRCFYLPLAACMTRIAGLGIGPEHEKAFSCDISFVGRLYEGGAYDRLIGSLPPEEGAILRSVLEEELCRWDRVRPWPRVRESLVRILEEMGFYKKRAAHGMDEGEFLGTAMISRKLAQMERITVLNALAEAHPGVRLYNTGGSSHLQGVEIHPPVNYTTDMSRVFSLSRINLNITLPSIETGLPQRVWDIMGSGGFLMTNRQEEAGEYFVPGEDMETFSSIGELLAKTDFYLRHEDLRLKILLRGFEKVMKHHTFEHRIASMLELA